MMFNVQIDNSQVKYIALQNKFKLYMHITVQKLLSVIVATIITVIGAVILGYDCSHNYKGDWGSYSWL